MEQFNFLLETFILPRENLDPILRFPGSHFRFFARFSHRYVVAFPTTAVLVRALFVGVLVFLAVAKGVLWLLREGFEGGKGSSEAERKDWSRGHLVGGVVSGAGDCVVAVVVIVVVVVVMTIGGTAWSLGARI